MAVLGIARLVLPLSGEPGVVSVVPGSMTLERPTVMPPVVEVGRPVAESGLLFGAPGVTLTLGSITVVGTPP